MKTNFQILLIFCLALGLCGVAPRPALAAPPVENAKLPAGLNAADWAQIKAQLPTAATPNSQQAYIKASNTNASDYFGYSIAISGDTVVVGAYEEDSSATGINGDETDNSVSHAGAAYVFVRNGTSWSQQAYLKASNREDDNFGFSVAISGDTIVVGAITESSNATGVNGDQANNSVSCAGAAYVFVRSGSIWSQQAYLKASNTDAFDYFGQSVAISGDTLVVGAAGESSNATGMNGDQANNSALHAGAAYVFVRSDSTWGQQAYLKASNTSTLSEFGFSTAISGDTVVVGAYGAESIYIFTRSGTSWSQQVSYHVSNGGSFGRSVAISGDTVVAGAPYTDEIYIFSRSGTIWDEQAYFYAYSPGHFGASVAISGDTVVVGAPYEYSSDNNAGAAYVFTRSGMDWSQQAYINASNAGAGDFFGSSVAISADMMAVGAYGEASSTTGVNGNQADNSAFGAGAAYVFIPNNHSTDITLSNSSVTENQPAGTLVGTLSTTDPDAGDTFTYSFTCAAPGTDDGSFAIFSSSLNTAAAFNFEAKNSYTICIRSTDTGGLFFDKNFIITITDVNEEMAKNGGFNTYPSGKKIPKYWTAANFALTDGKDTKVKKEGIASVKIIGALGKTKTLTQTLTMSGPLGDTFTFSYWVRASKLPKAGLCQAQVLFYSGSVLKGTKTLKCPSGATYNWKQANLSFTAPAAYTKVVIKFTFSKASGTAWFDGLSLMR